MSSKTYHILNLLNSSRSGMTSKQLFINIDDYESSAGIQVYLSILKSRGFVRTDGKLECKGCGHCAMCYRITEKGRIKLRELVISEGNQREG